MANTALHYQLSRVPYLTALVHSPSTARTAFFPFFPFHWGQQWQQLPVLLRRGSRHQQGERSQPRPLGQAVSKGESDLGPSAHTLANSLCFLLPHWPLGSPGSRRLGQVRICSQDLQRVDKARNLSISVGLPPYLSPANTLPPETSLLTQGARTSPWGFPRSSPTSVPALIFLGSDCPHLSSHL